MIDKLSIDFDLDDRGVSPVIGVILMVAITVILAAVIGAFVLNLGSSLGSSGPTAQLTVTDDPASLSSGSPVNILQITHKGGDELQASNLKLIIKDGDGNTVVTDSNMGDGSVDTASIGYQNSVPTEITVGTTLVLEETTADAFDSGNTGEYTIQIVHKPSGSMVLSSTVELE